MEKIWRTCFGKFPNQTTVHWVMGQIKTEAEDAVTFAIARNGIKSLDRLGTGAGHAFYVVQDTWVANSP